MKGLLEVRDLTVHHGGAVALSGVDLSIETGTVVGLIGPNEAGKTSCIDALTGFVEPVRGRILLGGTDITDLPAHRRAQLGLARTFQGLDLFEDLTVHQNLSVAARTPTWTNTLLDTVRRRVPDERAVHEVLDLVGVGELGPRRPDQLSNGQRHLVAVARSLVTRPRLVLLDEPAAGLDESETAELATLIRSLPELGVTVFLVDHDMSFVLGTCDHIEVLDLGSVIASGPPAAIRTDPAVITAYLGPGTERADRPGAESVASPSLRPRSTAEPARAVTDHSSLAPILEVRSLDAGHGGVRAVADLDLTVRPGEIVALIGANGAGKTTTLQTISGLLPVLGGSIRFENSIIGSPSRRVSPRRAADLTRRGLVQVSEDRDLFPDLTVDEHLRVTVASERSAGIDALLDRFPALRPLRNRRAGLLSGGEQQQLALARALRAGPRVLLIDELSLGLAPIIASELLGLVREIASDLGTGVLLVEQHVGAALHIADSATVLRRGKRVLSGPAAEMAGRLDEVERTYLG